MRWLDTFIFYMVLQVTFYSSMEEKNTHSKVKSVSIFCGLHRPYISIDLLFPGTVISPVVIQQILST